MEGQFHPDALAVVHPAYGMPQIDPVAGPATPDGTTGRGDDRRVADSQRHDHGA